MKIGSNRFLFILFFGLVFFPSSLWAVTDSDADGLVDEQEILFGTNVQLGDTDNDGFTDFEEIKNGFSPLEANGKTFDVIDTDTDGLLDWQELWFHTSKEIVDTDGDGFSDYEEVMFGFSPTDIVRSPVLERSILVDKTKQHLYYLVDGIALKNFPVSTGLPATQTPTGKFSILKKVPVMRYTGVGYDFKGVKWNLQFLPRYYLHTAYWHNDFGKRVRSHGCVNMRESDVGELYKYVNVGMSVNIIGETPKKLYVGK